MKGLALLALLGAQDSREERGKLGLGYFGKAAGVEEYRIERFDDGHAVLFSKARFTLEVQGQSRDFVVDTALTLDKNGRPQLYAGYHKAGGQDREVKIEWKRGIAVVDRGKEVRTSAPFVLDNNVYAQFLPILRTHPGGRRRIRVFRPALLTDADMVVEDKGEVVLRKGGRQVRTREYQITLGSMGITSWLDAEKRPVRIASPMVGGLAELEGFEGFVPESRAPPVTRPEGVEEIEISFPSGAIRLAGSITRPKGARKCPAVLLLSGSGPQDREGDGVDVQSESPLSVWAGPPWKGFRRIAYALSEAGILVLRTDDRGCGKSEGDFGRAKLSDFVADAQAAVGHLRAREDVGPVGLVGHSEGATVAMLAAARDPGIQAIFLMAGSGRPLDELLLEQIERNLREQGLEEDQARRLITAQRRMFDRIRDAEGDFLDIDERRAFIGWLREHFRVDPTAEIARVKGKVVILQGLKDRLVGPDHAEILRKARKDAEVRTFEGLDHLFMPSEGILGEYADPDRQIDPEFIAFLIESVQRHLR